MMDEMIKKKQPDPKQTKTEKSNVNWNWDQEEISSLSLKMDPIFLIHLFFGCFNENSQFYASDSFEWNSECEFK